MKEQTICIASNRKKIYFTAKPIAEEVLDDMGRVINFKGAIPDGSAVEFNSTLKTLKNYKNGKLDGKLQVADINTGKVRFTEEYEDGVLKQIIDTATLSPVAHQAQPGGVQEEDLELKKKQGLVFARDKEYVRFYKDGEEVARRSLQEGAAVEGKIPDGVIREFGESGAIKTQATYKNEFLDGELLRFDDGGRPLAQEFYKEGLLEGAANYTLYLPHTKLIEKAFYKSGSLEGERHMSLEGGQPMVIENFSNGKLNGKREVYFENNGILSVEENYKNGRYDGNRVLYHNNGGVWYKEFYKNGQLDGERVAYFPTGELYLKEHYSKGLLEGEKRIYDKNGTILFQEEYSYGAPVRKRKY